MIRRYVFRPQTPQRAPVPPYAGHVAQIRRPPDRRAVSQSLSLTVKPRSPTTAGCSRGRRFVCRSLGEGGTPPFFSTGESGTAE
jgi:hypothetical protein